MIVKYRDSFRDDWQDEVLKSGVLYHDIRWLDVLKNTYGLKPEYYVNIENERIIGGFPAFRIMGKLVSLPHLNYCGEYGNFPVDELQSQVKSTIYIKKILDNFSDLDENDYVTMRLNLPKKEDELWKIIGSKTRNLVRKGVRNKFRLESAKVDDFYTVYCKATNELGTPPHKKTFFNLIIDLFEDIAQIKIMRFDNRIVSCVLEMDYNGIRYDMWAFSNKEYFHLSPNMVLYYELLKSAVQSEILTYDFGRSRFNGGTFHFKEQWKAKPFKLSYSLYLKNINYPNKKELKAIQSETLSAIWSRTPSVVANFFGPYLRKYVY